jgi:phosphate transport system permease protein
MTISNPGHGSRAFRRKLTSQFFVAICVGAAALALIVLSLIMFSLFTKGVGGLDLMVFTHDTPGPDSPGGLRNAIIGSVIMCSLAMMIAVVVGILAGTWLAEIGGNTPYGHVVRFLNDVLLSAPSILIGLFIFEMMVRPMQGFSGWAGAVALGILATPIVTRTTEDILNLQPNALREAGMALGASQWVTVRKIIWKAAGAGLLTGGLLGFARISGETAPLLFTALNNQFFNLDMTKPMASLPTVIYQFAMSPFQSWQSLAWAGALLITATVLTINIIGRYLARERQHN